MIENNGGPAAAFHSHVFLGEGHEKSERKTWAVIWLCGAMMVVGGDCRRPQTFASIAPVADGITSTHAGALLLAALAYTYARKHANDPNFTFGTGTRRSRGLYQRHYPRDDRGPDRLRVSVSCIFRPVPIHFAGGVPIACLGLAVNIASAWLPKAAAGTITSIATAMRMEATIIRITMSRVK